MPDDTNGKHDQANTLLELPPSPFVVEDHGSSGSDGFPKQKHR